MASSALRPAATEPLNAQRRSRVLQQQHAPQQQQTTSQRRRLASATTMATPSTGSAEFDGGVGVALFRPPASLPRPKSVAPGRPGVAEFVGVGGKAVFASRLGRPSALESLRRYGLAGVLSYGILNTVWYAFSFATAWLYVASVPKGTGLAATAKAAARVFAVSWAGSQVTKAARIGVAALGAPLADRLIDWIRIRLDLPTRRAAFGVAVGCCALVAAAVGGGFIVAWS